MQPNRNTGQIGTAQHVTEIHDSPEGAGILLRVRQTMSCLHDVRADGIRYVLHRAKEIGDCNCCQYRAGRIMHGLPEENN